MRARMSANDHRYTNDRANVINMIISRRYIYTTRLLRDSSLMNTIDHIGSLYALYQIIITLYFYV